jgi:NIMA (never in mitosis gene a)-related kinase
MSLSSFQILNKLGLINFLSYLSYIGEGSYSTVYLVKRLSDNITYALKKVKYGDLSEKEQANALNEVRILASIKHPNIISYKEAFIDTPSSSLWYHIIHLKLIS